MALNNDDWELIRDEMEIDAGAKRIERRMYRNQLFLNLFPKHWQGKILNIELLVIGIPVLAFWVYFFIRVITRR